MNDNKKGLIMSFQKALKYLTLYKNANISKSIS